MKKTSIPALALIGALALTGCAANGTAPSDPASATTTEGPDTTPTPEPTWERPSVDVGDDATIAFAEVVEALGEDGYEVTVHVPADTVATLTDLPREYMVGAMSVQRVERSDGALTFARPDDSFTRSLALYPRGDLEYDAIAALRDAGLPLDVSILLEVSP